MRTLTRATDASAEPVPQPRWWHWLLCYVLYASLLYICYQGFWLCRSSIQDVTDVLLGRDLSRPAVYMAGTAAAGLVFFAIAMGGESYLRGSLTSPLMPSHFVSRLARRFARLLLAAAVPVALGAGAQEVLLRAMGAG